MHAWLRSLAAVVVLGNCCTAAVIAQTESLHRFAQSRKYGFKNDDGAVRIQPRYDAAGAFRENLAPVAVIQGREVARGGEYGNQCFVPALSWGYIDAAGRTVIRHQYAEAKTFSERMAAVRVGGLWGYIDASGRWAIKPAFAYAGDFKKGIAQVEFKDGRKTGYISPTGRPVKAPSGNGLDDGVGISYQSPPDTYTMTDRTGKVIVRRRDGLSLLGEGRVAYGRRGGPLGLMDVTGRTITPQTFASLGGFQDGLGPACVRLDVSASPAGDGEQRCGFIDTSGKLVLSPRFGFAASFEDGWAYVTDPVFGNGLTINRKGVIVHRESPDDEPLLSPFGTCQFPPPAPAPPPKDYSMAIDVQTIPPGAAVYLVPLWDWQSHKDGAQLLTNPDLLALYLVTQGATPLSALKLKMQVYMAVFELAGKRKVSRLVVSPSGPREVAVRF